MSTLLVFVVLLQANSWTASPPGATVGDTVWLTRIVAAPAGWGVRPTRLDPSGDVEPLSDPVIDRVAAGWRVRYAVVAWSPGRHTVPLPTVWLSGPAGRADSVPGGVARITIASVLPGTDGATPRPALAPVRGGRRMAWPPFVAAAVALALLAAGWRWRRRPPRALPLPGSPGSLAAIPDARWVAAGEPRAVAARAHARLRTTLARAVPAAHEALGTDECVAVVGRARPDLRLSLEDTLRALDAAAFGTEPGTGVAALAARARALARELGG